MDVSCACSSSSRSSGSVESEMVLFCSVPSSSTTSKALYADGDAVGMDPIYASNGGDISSCIEVGHGIGAAFFGSLLASSAKGDDGSAMFS